MEEEPETSGCCGEIVIDDTSTFVLKAQWIEFKLAHSLQKTFESVCGFIPVLPGAFSAYRWKVLSDQNNRVIDEYLAPFKSPEKMNWVKSNIFLLAEDRVKMEKMVKLTSYSSEKRCSGHMLTFVKSSKADTEGKKTLLGLVNQRRRWNNGAWFSMINSLFFTCNTYDIWRTKHTPVRKMMLLFQIMYYFLLVFFQWFSVGVYYLGFSMALRVINI